AGSSSTIRTVFPVIIYNLFQTLMYCRLITAPECYSQMTPSFSRYHQIKDQADENGKPGPVIVQKSLEAGVSLAVSGQVLLVDKQTSHDGQPKVIEAP